MTNQELINELGKQKDLIDRLAPEISEITADIREIMDKSKDPLFVGALMYKLISEREKTNKVLSEINEKYDKIMFELKTAGMKKDTVREQANESTFQILPEQDQMIIRFVEEKGSACAQDIQSVLNYKGQNAASQRLNKLFKDGYLKKVHSGKKVVYLVKT